VNYFITKKINEKGVNKRYQIIGFVIVSSKRPVLWNYRKLKHNNFEKLKTYLKGRKKTEV
jgi:hypothetical protein